MMKLDELTVTELKQGYTCPAGQEEYRCLECEASYLTGEIHQVGGRLLEARLAIRAHMELEHPDYLNNLIQSDSKYNTLTENQRELLRLFAAGTGDKEMARLLGVSASTIRHQRFMFREKAKQARLFLAVYEGVLERQKGDMDMMPIHDKATMVDQRYVVTNEERDHILSTSFLSLAPLRLREFSPKEKKKVVILARIAQEFQEGRTYTEGEVNTVLKEIYNDYATLRRYLIQYGFMERTRDGSQYWLTR